MDRFLDLFPRKRYRQTVRFIASSGKNRNSVELKCNSSKFTLQSRACKNPCKNLKSRKITSTIEIHEHHENPTGMKITSTGLYVTSAM